MNIAFCVQEKRYAKEIEKYFSQRQDEAVHIDYYEDVGQLLQAPGRAGYEWILLVTDHGTQEDIDAILTLQDFNVYSTMLLFSAAAGKRLWYWNGAYTGAFNGQPVTVAFRDIYLFESYRRVSYIHTKTDKLRVTATIRSEEDKLPSGNFARVNQGCIVNMQYIKEVDGSDIYMDNGVCCYISTRRKREFMRKYQLYHSKHRLFGNL